MMKKNALLLMLASLALLAACADKPKDVDATAADTADKTSKAAKKPAPVIKTTGCPQVAVIRDLSVYQNPPTITPATPLIINAHMGAVEGGCVAEPGGVTLDASFGVVASRGTQTAGHHVNLPFFVVLLDNHDKVLQKYLYEIPLVFAGDTLEVKTTLPLTQQLDLPPQADGADYRVLIGFQLLPNQVDANKQFFEKAPRL